MATKQKTVPTSATSNKPSSAHGDSSSSDDASGKQKHRLVSKTKIVAEYDITGNAVCICPTTDGGFWTCNDSTGLVTLRDKQGDTVSEINHGNGIRDISVSPKTQNLWACCLKDKTVMELTTEGKFNEKFRTEDQPWCVCATADGHVLVGMVKKITKCTTEGKVVLASKRIRLPGRRQLICLPSKIAECSTSHNVAMVEQDQPIDGGKDEPHILVMNKDFQELFRFQGSVPKRFSQAAKKKIESGSFFPFDVAFDAIGNVVVSDYNNCSIYLLNNRGEFLNLLCSNSKVVRAISVDYDNILWAVFGSFGSQTVKRLKYST
ncbi:uncharacterized protein LOC110463076 [Mizuhopecten yessoensis]|uniref:uncharacterized protein LOC110463076 n=1 Tax=Mizuhopecten yessoensis TaxID=6573 RepID=UPI000B45CED9|nr:uncharacterized protein LOC110463076 [Mizuhopecten yessoensis]